MSDLDERVLAAIGIVRSGLELAERETDPARRHAWLELVRTDLAATFEVSRLAAFAARRRITHDPGPDPLQLEARQ